MRVAVMVKVEYSDTGVLNRSAMISALEYAILDLENGESQVSIGLGGSTSGGVELHTDYDLNLIQIISEN